MPQNLCVLFTHTPLTEDGSRYSLFEGKGHKLGCHWLESGLLPEYPLVGQPPEMFPFGTDRFPFGDVLSRSSWLFELFEDTQHRNWLNFGGECGFYVALKFDKDPDPEQARKRVRDSLPEDAVAQAQSERIIWHYFVNHIGEPIPPEVTFASVNEQLEHCYHGIRETLGKFLREHSLEEHDTLSLINYELAWPEMLLYLGLKRPGPFFGVDTTSILRSFEGAELVPWSRPDVCHHVFKMRPPSVARATLIALELLRRLADAPVVSNSRVVEASAGSSFSTLSNGVVVQHNNEPSVPSGSDSRAARKEDRTTDATLSRLLKVYSNGLSDDRLRQAVQALKDDALTVDEKLENVDKFMPLPETASAQNLADMIEVSKTAVQKTKWWAQNRKGKRAN